MRQIEQLGQVLASMLGRLLKIKQAVPGGLSLEEIKRVYDEELDLSLDLLLNSPKEKITEVLESRVKFMDRQLEKMAEVLGETADLYEDSGEKEAARDLLEKSIFILEHLQESTGEYSLERVMAINRLRDRL